MIGRLVRGLTAPVRRAYGRWAIGGGQFDRARPLSREFGYDRGTPIDRHYIEGFLQAHFNDIRGRVLEIGSDDYSRRFGAKQVSQQDVLHVHAGHPRATIVGDLSQAETLPPATFDCMILTQTLQLIYDMQTAVAHIHEALKPGGVALMTVPGVSAIDRGEWGGSWFWSLTEASVTRLLSDSFGPDAVTVETFGNLFAATAFLHGACVEEVDAAKLTPLDDAYPVTIAARARRRL